MRYAQYPTPELIRELLDYDQSTGIFVWKTRSCDAGIEGFGIERWNVSWAGRKAGSVKRGYVYIRIGARRYRAHRLAWIYIFGVLSGDLDHINGDTTDNRIDNLRVVNHAINAKNQKRRSTNTSGVTGVCPVKNGWRAYAYVDRKCIDFGTFSRKADAIRARKKGEKLHGFHPNHGRVM